MTMRSLHQGAPLRGGLSETGGPMMPEPVLGERHAETIQQSHERCMTLGLNRTDRVDFPTLSRNELALARERNHRLYLHAAPVMETLFSQILDSQSMVVLTDANGTILHTIGPDAFLQRAAKVALSPGVNWSESTKGTNAIGTALIEELPTLVHGAEHFINANHFLTCSAAPILDPRGNILGVLDVTGDQHTFHPYTLGLVRMSVRMIENHWFSDDHRNVGHIYLHARPEFLGTLTEGILAVNPDGRIMGANRGAQEQLGMSSAALRMHTVTSLFGATMGLLWLSTVPVTSALVAQIFGPRYMGTLFGIVFFSHQMGAFLGAWLGGYVYDETGSYEIVWWISAGLGLMSALIHLPINARPVERLTATAQ